MKFYGKKNMCVYERNHRRKDAGNIYKRNKLVFRFDENGEFETDNPELIKRLSRRFRSEDIEITDDAKLRHCRKCDFACETQGELLKHYREQHPK